MLSNAKKSGHKRTGPQESPVKLSRSTKMFKCDECKCELESEGLLDAHIKSHQISSQVYASEHCDLDFLGKNELEKTCY